MIMKENLKRVKIIQLPTLLKINKNGLQPFKLDNYFIPQTGAFARKLAQSHKIKTYHLYFISLKSDETFEVGDFVLLKEENSIKGISKCSKIEELSGEQIYYIDNNDNIFYTKDKICKIIASTDETLDLPRPFKSFLQKYCDSDGKIEFVNIECEVDYNKDCKLEKFGSKINIYSKCNQFKKNDLDCTDCKMAFYKLKVAKDNTITIHPLKNLYKREEVVTLLAQILGDSAKENYSQMNLREKGTFLWDWLNKNLE